MKYLSDELKSLRNKEVTIYLQNGSEIHGEVIEVDVSLFVAKIKNVLYNKTYFIDTRRIEAFSR